ncbi:MAG TPA: oligopeptide/dipeptide ABC transporter ATP-binding protein [Thermoplasmata archaeon]|nr:oligopeptide/dipeptide ABC transporter ATP-binding protein [Thermoplasmata archaeon]
MPLLSVRNLKVHFKVQKGWVRAVDGVSLEVDEGETVGLVGESGCGKTTLAYAITQLLPTNAYVLGGEIIFGGDSAASRFRAEYWQLAESRMRAETEALKAKLGGFPKTPDDSPSGDAQALEDRIEKLEDPLAGTYRKYLAREIQTLRQKLEDVADRAEAGDAKARRLLGEATARYEAANQEGDLLAITRLKDGRLRGYHPKLNAIRWKQISIVFQGAMNALNPVYTVGEQIIEAIQAHEDMDDYEARNRVKELYKLVGIPVDRIDNFPHEYSGGMKQRAMIAMALSLNPKLVIMDEPTTALDVITAAKIMDEVLAIQKALRMTLIIISHDVSTVAKVADRIAVMYAGQIVEEAPSQDLFHRTLHPYTEGLLGAFPSVKGEKHRLEAIPGSPPSLLTPPSGCRFHPRCKYAKDICTSTEPPYVVPQPGHRALCHFSQDFFSQGGLTRT